MRNTLSTIKAFVKGKDQYFMVLPMILIGIGVGLQIIALILRAFGG